MKAENTPNTDIEYQSGNNSRMTENYDTDRTAHAEKEPVTPSGRSGLMLSKTLFVTTALCLLPMLFGLAVYSRLPEQVPSHFDLNGNVNGTMARAHMAFYLPVLMAVLNVVVHFVMEADPKRRNYPPALKLLMKWLLPVMTCVLQPLCLLKGMGIDLPVSGIVMELIGILFIVCGNYLPKCRQNYTMGIKTPWTLNSEENWNKTHHLAGYLWIVCGICLMATGIWKGNPYAAFGGILIAAFIPFLYSYLLYRKGI